MQVLPVGGKKKLSKWHSVSQEWLSHFCDCKNVGMLKRPEMLTTYKWRQKAIRRGLEQMQKKKNRLHKNGACCTSQNWRLSIDKWHATLKLWEWISPKLHEMYRWIYLLLFLSLTAITYVPYTTFTSGSYVCNFTSSWWPKTLSTNLIFLHISKQECTFSLIFQIIVIVVISETWNTVFHYTFLTNCFDLLFIWNYISSLPVVNGGLYWC